MEAKFDKIYKDIVDTIVEKGIWSEGNVRTKYADGTAAHYKSYIGYQFRLDNSDDEAHLITSRFAPSKAPIRELYWIWILQSNNVDILDKLGCKFWDEDVYKRQNWKLKNALDGDSEGNPIGDPITPGDEPTDSWKTASGTGSGCLLYTSRCV